VQALLDVVVERAAALLPARAASIAVLNARTSALVYRAAAGDAAIVGRAFPSDGGFAGAAFTGRCVVRVDDASRDPRHARSAGRDSTFVAGPLLVAPLLVAPLRETRADERGARADSDKSGDRVLGAIVVSREHGAPAFHADDERLLQLIANRVAFAVDAEEQKDKARARDRLESMGRMLAGIVHDFRTPMTVISGYVQLMASTDDAAERQQSAEHVLQGTEQMSTMIKQLLAFARGDADVLLRKVWVENFVADAAEMLRRLVADADVDLAVDMRSRAAVRVDELKLKRALANLVKNAREALESRAIASTRGRIDLSVTDDGDDVVFRVADNGPGLPPAMEERLFQEFATFGKQDGTGLGLALVKRIVEEHGGCVVVDNRPGAGCAFALKLPKA
jgi:signal transduction histidine kinase